MKNFLVWTLVIIAAAIAVWYFSVRQDMAEVEEATVERPTVAVPVDKEPAYPIEDIEVPKAVVEEEEVTRDSEPVVIEEPLPALAQSDEVALGEAEEITQGQSIRDLLQTDFLISRLVTAVDSLSSERVAPLSAPTKPVPGRFSVLTDGEEAVISPENAERYEPYVEAIGAMDVDRTVESYVRYYPLFQEAFEELGREGEYFNDRVIGVIDELLATPQPMGLIEVVQNEAVWEFKDPELESLTAGQKALIRLGEDQGEVVRAKLREFREALTGAGPTLQDQPEDGQNIESIPAESGAASSPDD